MNTFPGAATHMQAIEPGSLQPIVLASRGGALPLSSAQQRLWFCWKFQESTAAYHVGNAVRLRGRLNRAALNAALDQIVKRHESLRTCFVERDGTATQVIAAAEQSSFVLSEETLIVGDSNAQECVQRAAREQACKRFDLERGPLIRARLLELDDQDHVLLITMHEIVSDGWSMDVMMRELSMLFAVHAQGRPAWLPDLPFQYVDYIRWQDLWLQGRHREELLLYWRGQLQAIETLQLPTDRVRPAIPSHRGATFRFVLPQALSRELAELARREGATLFMVLLAGLQGVLARHSGQSDIVVGSTVAGRLHRQSRELIGNFRNALVLRTDVSGDLEFLALLARVKEVTLDAYAHQDIPFEELVTELQIERDLSRHPIFQVMFELSDPPRTPRPPLPLSWSPMEMDWGTAKFDLALYCVDTDRGITCALEYAIDLFDAISIERLAEHLRSAFQQIANDPRCPISQWPLLTSAPRTPPLYASGDDLFARQEIDQSITARFDQQVARFATRLAVSDGTVQWTYQQLDAYANAIAHAVLARCPSGPNRVGLLAGHSAMMVAGIIGLLKAGKTYVPLDPTLPVQRLAFVARDAGAELVVAEAQYAALLDAQLGAQRILSLATVALCPLAPELTRSADALSYVLYTSGSTGEPKGVVQRDRHVLHFISAYTNSLRIDADDRLTLFASFAFDAAVMDIFGALLNGASLHLRDLRRWGSDQFDDWLNDSRITLWHSTPTVFRMLARSLRDKVPTNVRLVVLGGEEATPADLALLSAHFPARCRLVNGYGPTESTVTLQYAADRRSDMGRTRLPIGQPVQATQIALLSPEGRPTTLAGELAICSDYVALGYWGREEQTARAFSVHPEDGVRIYRTGDRVRYRADGNLEFMERVDHQVKIRGFRIELGEIETQLLLHSQVKEAAVVAREEVPGEKCLVAYVTPREHTAPSAMALREHLKQTLPEHMLPSAYVVLPSLPLTPNGKLNRRALPAPQLEAYARREYEAPQAGLEAIVAGIWRSLLRVERVGRHDNFFELGGNSLSSLKLIVRIADALGPHLSAVTIFRYSTLQELAQVVEVVLAEGAPPSTTNEVEIVEGAL